MMTSEKVTAVFTVVLAMATLGLACATWKSLASTREDVRETRRSRVDATAPRVTFVGRDYSWPPHLINSSNVVDRTDLRPEGWYHSHPRDAQVPIYVAARFELHNEGAGLAIVELPVDAVRLLGSEKEPPKDHQTWSSLNTADNFTLEPGERTLIWVRSSVGSGDWAARCSGLVRDQAPLVTVITVTDTMANGVTDQTEIHLRGRPIVPSGLHDHQWYLNRSLPGQRDNERILAAAALTVRKYKGEPAPTRRPLRRSKRLRRWFQTKSK